MGNECGGIRYTLCLIGKTGYADTEYVLWYVQCKNKADESISYLIPIEPWEYVDLEYIIFIPAGVSRRGKQTAKPTLTSADVIVDATISLNKPMTSAASSNVEIHKVLGPWDSTTITWATQPEFESDIAAYVPCWEAGWYTWNITEVVQDWYEDVNYGMMFKVPDSVENESTANTWKQFYSSDFSTSADTMPVPPPTAAPSQSSPVPWTGSPAPGCRAHG